MILFVIHLMNYLRPGDMEFMGGIDAHFRCLFLNIVTPFVNLFTDASVVILSFFLGLLTHQSFLSAQHIQTVMQFFHEMVIIFVFALAAKNEGSRDEIFFSNSDLIFGSFSLEYTNINIFGEI